MNLIWCQQKKKPRKAKSQRKVSYKTIQYSSKTAGSNQESQSKPQLQVQNDPKLPNNLQTNHQKSQSRIHPNRNRQSLSIGSIGKVIQSGQSGKYANLAKQEIIPIWPIGTTLQSGKACNQDNRKSLAIRLILKVLQSGGVRARVICPQNLVSLSGWPGR